MWVKKVFGQKAWKLLHIFLPCLDVLWNAKIVTSFNSNITVLLIDAFFENLPIQWFVYVTAWAWGQLRINFMRIFKVITKLPESRSDKGNLENNNNSFLSSKWVTVGKRVLHNNFVGDSETITLLFRYSYFIRRIIWHAIVDTYLFNIWRYFWKKNKNCNSSCEEFKSSVWWDSLFSIAFLNLTNSRGGVVCNHVVHLKIVVEW